MHSHHWCNFIIKSGAGAIAASLLSSVVFAEVSSPVTNKSASILEFKLPSGDEALLEAHANPRMDPLGNKLTYDRNMFYINDQPIFLYSGEIQYARVPESEWEDRIIKAKNSGLNCIATYFFWSAIEPVQGVFNFSGRYDIHRFVDLCRKHGMFVILRLGPIANGELRNGGLPQWVRERIPGKWKTELYPTPEWYFDAVKIYYEKICQQVSDFFPSRGGNVVMVQIDNETHVPWLWGKPETKAAAQDTINRLTQLARDAGFEGPFACTGWLAATGVIPDGVLPLTGFYPLKNWVPFETQKLGSLAIRDASNFHFKNPPVDPSAQPFFAIENQGGCGYYSVTPDSFAAAFTACDIARGINGTSYYIFSGGTNPRPYPGPYDNLYHGEEGLCHPDTLRMSYDFGAPLGEFQQTRESVNFIRRLGLFLTSFGDTVQRTRYIEPVIPEVRILGERFQAGFRGAGNSGFVFINSYKLPDDQATEPLSIVCRSGDRTVSWPNHSTLHVRRNHPVILPFRLNIGGVAFRYATASPLCRFSGMGAEHAVFYANENEPAEFFFDGINENSIEFQHGAKLFPQPDGMAAVVDPTVPDNLVVIRRAGKPPLCIKVLTERDSLRAYRLDGLSNHLILTDLIPLDLREGELRFEYTEEHGRKGEIALYPAKDFGPGRYQNQWTRQTVALRPEPAAVAFSPSGDGSYRALIDPRTIPADAKELWITTTPLTAFYGAEFYVDGLLGSDTYYRREVSGAFAPWTFGVKRFLQANRCQWVVQQQADGKHIRLLNKVTSEALAITGDSVKQVCLVDGRKPCTPNQLWEIVNGTSIRNAQAELWLGADAEGNLVLKKTGDEENRHWDIAHTDECYSSIRNVATGKFLDVSAKGFLSATKLDAKFEVIFKSFEFAPFVPGKTSRAPIKYTYGDFARVASVSYLKEGSVELEPCLSSVPELK